MAIIFPKALLSLLFGEHSLSDRHHADYYYYWSTSQSQRGRKEAENKRKRKQGSKNTPISAFQASRSLPTWALDAEPKREKRTKFPPFSPSFYFSLRYIHDIDRYQSSSLFFPQIIIAIQQPDPHDNKQFISRLSLQSN